MTEWAPEEVYLAFAQDEHSLIPPSRLDIILEQCETSEMCFYSCADYCVKYNPEYLIRKEDTWKKFSLCMRRAGANSKSLAIVEKIRKIPSGLSIVSRVY